MTAVQGDLPDWTIQAAPNVFNVSVFNQGFNVNTPLISSSSPFRIWGAWISGVMSSDGTYAGTGLNDAPRLILADNSLLLAAELVIETSKDKNNMFCGMNWAGFTPPTVGGHYTVNFVTNAGQTDTFLFANCGLFYSIP